MLDYNGWRYKETMFNKTNISSKDRTLIILYRSGSCYTCCFLAGDSDMTSLISMIMFMLQKTVISSPGYHAGWISLGVQYQIFRFMASFDLAVFDVRLSTLRPERRRLSSDKSYPAYSEHSFIVLAL